MRRPFSSTSIFCGSRTPNHSGTVAPMRRTHRAQRTPDPSLTPLLVQAGAARALGSIVTFLSTALLCLGVYILVEVIRHPLDAQPTEVIGAAVMIALAATMLYYLFEPRTAARLVHRRHVAEPPEEAGTIPTPLLSPPPAESRSERSFASSLSERGTVRLWAQRIDSLEGRRLARLTTPAEWPRSSAPPECGGGVIRGQR